MSDLQRILDMLQDSERASSAISQALEARPDDVILRSNLASLKKRGADLNRRLDYALRVSQSELVRYRIVRDWSDSYPAKAVAASIAAFQELVTAVFDALRTQPKLRYRPAIESEHLSTFEFAGAAAGSVIVSLAIPNDRLLVGETELDRTFALVEQALSARDSEDLKILADIVGVAAITKAYTWARETSNYGLDVEIKWGKSLNSLRDLTITREDAAIVKDLIENKSEVVQTTVEVVGRLLGFDGATSYFHLETSGERKDIRGNVAPGLPKAWTTDRVYSARMLRTSQIKYATGEEMEKYTLLALEPITDLRLPAD